MLKIFCKLTGGHDYEKVYDRTSSIDGKKYMHLKCTKCGDTFTYTMPNGIVHWCDVTRKGIKRNTRR